MSTEHQQIRESAEALAEEIKTRHNACQNIHDSTIEWIENTIKARMEIAGLVEAAYAGMRSGVRFAKWWRDMDLPAGWATRYLTLARTAERHTLGDKGQLRLIGLLPEPEPSEAGRPREANLFGWCKWAGKIRTTLTVETIQAMGQTDREVAAKQLEPLVEVYRQLTEGAAV